ncbi:lysozyme G [Ciona intestinalis]
MAYERDLRAMEPYKEGIIQAARNNNLEPSLIAGIASRESNGGRALDKDGLGDHGNGFGIMQVNMLRRPERLLVVALLAV